MTRLLVTADLHLEKGMDYSDDRLGEQESVWAWIVRLAVNHECDAILFAGDATEYRAPSSAARAAFQRPLVGLDIPVLAIPGNHDVKHPRYPTALALMAPGLGGQLVIESHKPEVIEVAGVAVCTLPWSPMGTFKARNAQATFPEAAEALLTIAEALCITARADYPGCPVVLLGHWAIDASYTPTGHSAADFHEPVLPLAELARCDFDAAVFGHVHKPQLLGSPDREKVVLVPGSPMPLDFGEATCEHGVWLLDCDQGMSGKDIGWLPIESRRFVTLDLDADEAQSIAEGHGVGWDVDEAIVRVRYSASEEQARRIGHATMRRALLDAGAHRVWQIAPQIERVERRRAPGMTAALTPAQAIDLWLEGRENAPDGLRDRALQIIEQVAA